MLEDVSMCWVLCLSVTKVKGELACDQEGGERKDSQAVKRPSDKGREGGIRQVLLLFISKLFIYLFILCVCVCVCVCACLHTWRPQVNLLQKPCSLFLESGALTGPGAH